MSYGDKVLGCILGGAIGDAYGGAYEGSIQPVEMSESQPWRLSDDTQMTIATCEAITSSSGLVRPEAIAARFLHWFKEGRITGIGASTYKALSELARGGHWALVGNKGEMAAGNGPAMRAAPLAFRLDPMDEKSRQTLRDVCRITHHNDEAYVGALAVVAAVRVAWAGAWAGKGNLLCQVAAFLPDSGVKDRVGAISNLGDDVPLPEVARRYGSSGYVIESVPLALLGAQRAKALGFKRMIEDLIRGGGDTDTIASMAGHIAGTLVGRSGLPPDLLERLPDRDSVERAASQLAEVVLRKMNLTMGSGD